MKVLITGGAGFIGTTVASLLLAENHEVIIYDIGSWDTSKDEIKYIKGDVFDTGHLAEAIRGCDSIIHMVGLPDARAAQEHPQMSFDLNIRSLQTMLEVIKGKDAIRLVVPSSAAIYGTVERSPIAEEISPKPANVYGYHKYIAEKLAETYSLNYRTRVTVLRLFNVYGIQGSGILNILLEKASRGEPISLYGATQKRDFIHISDAASAFVRVLTLDNGFEVFNVGTGVGRSILELVDLVKERFPDLVIKQGDFKGILYDSVADISKLKEASGFNPDGGDGKLRGMIDSWVTE